MNSQMDQNIAIKDNFVEGNEALSKLQELLSNQHGEVAFTDSLKVARLERNLIDSIVLARKHK